MTIQSWEKEAAYIKGLAKGRGMIQTLSAMSIAKQLHDGQMRKGGGPYIQHPVRVCSHLISLGVLEDSILAAALLHDIIEDTSITLSQLEGEGISDSATTYIDRLSKKPSMSIEKYYDSLANSKSGLVKLSDRCNNISTMANAFSRDKILEYIEETETYVLPMAKELKPIIPQYADAIFAMRYHIEAVIAAYKSVLLVQAVDNSESGADRVELS